MSPPREPISLPVVDAKEIADIVRKDFGRDDRLTCEDCKDNRNCEYAFDPYNFGGECLALK